MLSILGTGNLPRPASFVGALALSGGTTATPASVGAVAGDLAIAFTFGSVTSGSGNSWTSVSGASWPVYYKELEAGDTAAGIAMADGGSRGAVVIYHGAKSVVRVAAGFYTGFDSDVTFNGYVKNAAHAGQLARGRFSFGGGGSISVLGVANFTSRIDYTDASRTNVVLDWLAADRPDYVDLTQFNASLGGDDLGGFSGIGEIFELRT